MRGRLSGYKDERHLNIPKKFCSLLLSFVDLGCARLFKRNVVDEKCAGYYLVAAQPFLFFSKTKRFVRKNEAQF